MAAHVDFRLFLNAFSVSRATRCLKIGIFVLMEVLFTYKRGVWFTWTMLCV